MHIATLILYQILQNQISEMKEQNSYEQKENEMTYETMPRICTSYPKKGDVQSAQPINFHFCCCHHLL